MKSISAIQECIIWTWSFKTTALKLALDYKMQNKNILQFITEDTVLNHKCQTSSMILVIILYIIISHYNRESLQKIITYPKHVLKSKVFSKMVWDKMNFPKTSICFLPLSSQEFWRTVKGHLTVLTSSHFLYVACFHHHVIILWQ